jgi:hypothetical protein
MIYTYTKSVNPSRLAAEVPQTNFSHIETNDTTVHIHYTDATDESALSAVVTAHVAVTTEDVVSAAIARAVVFGQGLILEYATSNVIAAFSLEQIKDIMTRTAAVQQALNTGSLYVAMDALDNIETDETLITPTRVLEFKNKIETYLGLPLSEPT